MVLIEIKRTEQNHFLFEAPADSLVDDVTRQIVEVHNLRLKMERLAGAVKDLADYGPIKPEEKRGITEAEELKMEESGEAVPPAARGPHYREDPNGYRTGEGCAPELAEVLKRTAEEGLAVVSKRQAAARVPLTARMIQEAIDNVRGAVMIAYPAYHGLPEYEPAWEVLENREVLEGKQDILEILDPETAQMWFAGKEMQREKKLSTYAGRNDKTKIVVRVQKRGAGPPVREPAVDEETHKKMLAFYFKKQEEAKKLAEDDEDAYMNSSWANPRALKNQLVGGGRDVSWRPR